MEESRTDRPVMPAEISGWGSSRPARGKTRYDRPQGAQQGRPSFGDRPHRPKPPKAWAHQDLLKRFIGQQLNVTLMDGAVLKGKLVELDQYTLLLETQPAAGGLLTLVFKHDVSSITGITHQ